MNRRRMPNVIGRRMMARRQPNLYVAILFIQLLERVLGLDPKPPVTLLLIFLNLGIFYFAPIAPFLPPQVATFLSPIVSRFSVRAACLNPRAVLSGQRARLLLSSFVHLSDAHVLFNCTSFVYKGVTLEAAMGSAFFLALIVYLAVTSQLIYVAIALIARHYGHSGLMNRCVAGFSGVLFGLKVIVNSNPNYQHTAANIFGIPLPGGIAPWTELFMASALMPNVSFIGHLSGILAGILYVILPKLVTRFILPFFRRLRLRRTLFPGPPRHLNQPDESHHHTE